MQHFFVDKSNIDGKIITITGDDVKHIKNVLRMKPGEEISVSDGESDREYRCEIVSLDADEIVCKLLFIKEDGVELPVKVTLFQALPKGDKMETIIQKCVELGVAEIVPTETHRCVMKLDDKKKKTKVERYQAIAEAAAKQSKRAYIPKVKPVMTFKQAIASLSEYDVIMIPYEMSEDMDTTKTVFNSLPDLKDAKVAVFIGPEGGFEESEVEAVINAGGKAVSLGRRILRTETAGMTVMSFIIYVCEIS